jgi:hypothetical protein
MLYSQAASKAGRSKARSSAVGLIVSHSRHAGLKALHECSSSDWISARCLPKYAKQMDELIPPSTSCGCCLIQLALRGLTYQTQHMASSASVYKPCVTPNWLTEAQVCARWRSKYLPSSLLSPLIWSWHTKQSVDTAKTRECWHVQCYCQKFVFRNTTFFPQANT